MTITSACMRAQRMRLAQIIRRSEAEGDKGTVLLTITFVCMRAQRARRREMMRQQQE
ncbi:MAG: hypothetical protein Q4D81_03820 [Eubacteriales bacterium]|nr:hypothetical protein [Eubacteriales bacterium]